jgi:hypothetical protein
LFKNGFVAPGNPTSGRSGASYRFAIERRIKQPGKKAA